MTTLAFISGLPKLSTGGRPITLPRFSKPELDTLTCELEPPVPLNEH
jgi:hypothetical protein